MEAYISLHGFCAYEVNIDFDVEIGGEGDGRFDGRLVELIAEVRKLYCEYFEDDDPTVEGFRRPEDLSEKTT